MKTRTYLVAAILTLTSFGLFAQKAAVNVEKSTVHWLGKKIGGQHDGFIKLKSGTLVLKNNKLVSGNFVIDMTTITNTDLADEGYKQKLVGHLKSDDFFGVDKFPTATLIVTSSTTFVNGKATLTGVLTIKGKKETITFDVVKTGNTYTAKIDVDRSKFDIKYGSTSFFDNLGDKAIDNIFTLDIVLELN
jgi:polyisoprenoid-binding protein YceI